MPQRNIPLGAVFDCNLCLRSIIAPYGLAAACFDLLGTEAVTVFVSRDILSEVKETLSRSSLQQKFPELTHRSTERILERLRESGILIYNVPETFRYPRDPDDEIYINLALVTNTDFLVTYDTDLLDLMGASAIGQDFQHRFPKLQVVQPKEFLDAVRGSFN